jgi:UDP-glucose:(heptosyl)LPS alpha-1,3-glucosyltransferase
MPDVNYSVALVVRRFQPLGGMEGYVWHLAHALSQRCPQVVVLCKEFSEGSDIRIEVKTLRCLGFGSGWVRLMLFSGAVASYARTSGVLPLIVHSHERTSIHHVTTFHGPPFALIHTYPFLRRWSLRAWAYLWMERRELCAPNVLAVVPNSSNISTTLAQYYSCMGGRLRRPIPPGVEDVPTRTYRAVAQQWGLIGFVGKEWRRKGLETALAICAALARERPKLVLRIYGPDPAEIKHLVTSLRFAVECMGWRDAKPELCELDLLLHPARSEPYGMVISEAMAAQVPVVVSDACGAAVDVSASNGVVLPVDSSLGDWVKACESMLSLKETVPAFRRSWDDVALEYIALYEEVAQQLASVNPKR